MRVLTVGNMYPPHHLGGYELVWQSAVRHLRDAGHEVRVLTTDYQLPAAADGESEDADVHRQLRWYWRDDEFPRIGLRARLDLERHNQRVLAAQLEQFDPDVVSWWAMGGMSMSLIEAVRRRGLPAVGFVLDEWMIYGPRVDAWQRLAAPGGRLGPLLERLTGLPASSGLGAAARWIFISESVRAHADAALGGLAAAGIAHAGIDNELFTPADPDSWKGRLLYAGRIEPRKGVEEAISALSRIEGATLILDGPASPAYAEELERLAERSGVGGRVSIRCSPRSGMRGVYAAADAVLFPVQWQEPWGLVPLEAMAVGRPVVATGSGGSAEYLDDGRNCLIYEPPADPAALATAVGRLAGDPALCERLRSGGFETAARYTEGRFGEAVIAEVERAVRV